MADIDKAIEAREAFEQRKIELLREFDARTVDINKAASERVELEKQKLERLLQTIKDVCLVANTDAREDYDEKLQIAREAYESDLRALLGLKALPTAES